jgi:hypothetical protein
MQYYERAKSIPWKSPPYCNATSSKFHYWHYTCWWVSFSRHLPHPNPPIRLPHGIVWFVTTNHIFPVVHCPVASLFTPYLAITDEILRLWAAAQPRNLIPLNSRRTVMVLAWQFIALWNPWVIVSLDVWWVSQTTFFNADSLCQSLNVAYPAVVSLWLCLHVSTSKSCHQTLTQVTWKGLQCSWQISYWCGNQ